MEEMTLLDTADLRNYIEAREAVPEDPDQCYIVDWSIDDSDVVSGKPRFTVTFSTVNLLKRLNNAFIQVGGWWWNKGVNLQMWVPVRQNYF